MSLMDLFRRYVDPIVHADERRDRERKRETAAPTVRNRPILTCHVCGFEGENLYCPRCLAGTMGPRRRR